MSQTMIRILAILLLVVVCTFTGGGYAHYRWMEAKTAKIALHASEQVRKDEHDNAVSTIRKLDSYSVTTAQNQVRALSARSDRERVQHSLAAIAAAAPASACGPDPRLAGIAQLLSEGAGLVEEGAGHVDELRAKRNALK
jgi:hypothetical protein